MDPFLERLRAYVGERALLQPEERVLIGLSGGVDSVVLAHALLELAYPLLAVHVNYQLRGAAADGDEAFVRAWCSERRVPLEVRTFDTEHIATSRGLSVQQAARDLRYETFRDRARAAGIAKVALGHHRDDQAETLLLNLFRGTGLEGLAGMPVRRRLSNEIFVIRPLLDQSRAEIESYAAREKLEWREDVSNTKAVYRRGVLRSEVLPVIERHFGPGVRDRLARTAGLVRAYLDATLNDTIREAFDAAVADMDGESALRLDALDDLPDVMRRRVIVEALRRWLPDVEASAQTAGEIDELRSSQPGRRQEYGGGVVWRERDRLLFRLEARPETDEEETVEAGGEAHLAFGTVAVERLDAPPARLDSGSSNEVFIDASVVSMPLTVRTWRDGDRFRPLGMQHPKKLSDFLTDERIPPHQKGRAYVLVSEGRIVWVVGLRIDHDVRVTDETTATLRLSYHPTENQADG